MGQVSDCAAHSTVKTCASLFDWLLAEGCTNLPPSVNIGLFLIICLLDLLQLHCHPLPWQPVSATIWLSDHLHVLFRLCPRSCRPSAAS